VYKVILILFISIYRQSAVGIFALQVVILLEECILIIGEVCICSNLACSANLLEGLYILPMFFLYFFTNSF